MTPEEKPLTELQKSMRANYPRPLLSWQTLVALVLGFALYPVLMHFSFPFFRREAHGGRIAVNDSRPPHQEPICDDTWLFLRRAEISHEIVQTLELHHLGNCGDVRLPARNRQRYPDYVARDPGFVLPEQFPAYRGNAHETYMRHQLFVTKPQQMPRGRIAEAAIGQELRGMPSE